MTRTATVAADDLSYLRGESLVVVQVCMGLGLYCWAVVLFVTHELFGPWWRGTLILAVGMALHLVLQRRSFALASALLIGSLVVSQSYAMWMGDMVIAPHMLAVAVGLTSLLFGRQMVGWATLLCTGLLVAIATLRLGYSLFAAELFSAVLLTNAVGVLSSLAVRNLYTTLTWAWNRAMAAERNEEALRDRQAELGRALKALDEAYQRLEYVNYDLARAQEAAEKARLAKQEFATNVSHELRTPLNVITAFSEIMYLSPESYDGVPLPAKYRADMREIYRSGQHLLQLIDDVLDLSRVEARQMKLTLERVPLREVIVEAVDLVRPLVRTARISLHIDAPDDLPPLMIDRARVRQVLLNLLNNARRFTDSGSIAVTVAREADQVLVTVADTGTGIAPSEHAKLFKEFWQLGAVVDDAQRGSGLGLAISKRFVEMHGGRIWVESEGTPGQGSRFHFTLPLDSQPADADLLRSSPKPYHQPMGRGRTLLLLDEDAQVAHRLEQSLENYRIVPVAEPSEIPARAAELRAVAALVDPLRNRQGWRQLRQRAQEWNKRALPIILCPLSDGRRLSQELAVTDYLLKPISRTALLAALEGLGEGVRRILIVEDDPQMVRVLMRIIQSSPVRYEVACASSGSEGLRQMRESPPDLVLLDLRLPDMDGREVLAHMRRDEMLRHVAVIVVSAVGSEGAGEWFSHTLAVYAPEGFTAREAQSYLQAILEGAVAAAS